MIINLQCDKIEVGMFVILPNCLIDNPFWKSKFIIKNEKQIKKIVKAGFKEVKVDSDKSIIEIKVDKLPEPSILTDEIVYDYSIKEAGSLLTPDAPVVVEKPNDTPVLVEKPNMEAKADFLEIAIIPDKKVNIKKETATSTKWEPEKFMSPELVEAVKDTSMPPVDRAKVVHDYSTELIKNILESPTAENITASKKGITEIVNVIMDEDETCGSLTKIVSHDFYTYTHSVNVGVKSLLLAKLFYGESGEHDMRELGAGFFLHDVGKVKIPLDIINKPGKLDDTEMDIMRGHPNESRNILLDAEQLTAQAKIIVLQHHERADGKGYPRGLKGFDIHPYAAICCLADVYDALTGKRSYKEGKPPKVAIEIMQKEMSNHFNKDMLNDFVDLFKRNGAI